MTAFGLALEQLPKDAQHLSQGGVVRIMERVEEGYVYLRPDADRVRGMHTRRRGGPMRVAVALLLLLMIGTTTPAAAASKALDDLLFDLQLEPLAGQTPPA